MKGRKLVGMSLALMTAITDDDQTLPITNMIDELGEETTDPQAASRIVAGPTAAGKWLVDWVENFTQESVH